MEDEIVQYFVVNSELNMSVGKIAAQVAHVATNITLDIGQSWDFECDDPKYDEHEKYVDSFKEWHENNQPKIILRAKEKDLLKLINLGWYYIRDNGRTEIPENSLTVVGCAPNYKSELQRIVKRFQLL